MFANNSYASVWTKEELKSKAGKAYGYNSRIAITRKAKDSNGDAMLDASGKQIYNQTFSGYVKFVGDAAKVMANVEVPEGRSVRVKLVEVATENRYDKEKKQTFYTHTVFKCEALSDSNGPSSGEDFSNTSDDDENLPF